MRRFELPIAVFLVAVAFLVARLYDVQVTQHAVWATEAANLVRSHHVEPYRRGDIRDREGRVVARDHEVYELEFVWRDFRRGHPLGQVAMAWSLVLGSPVSLAEAQRDLSARAAVLSRLSPREVLEFGRGAPLALAGVEVVADAPAELAALERDATFGARPGNAGEGEVSRGLAAQRLRRGTRAGDLGFYVYRLLGLSSREERALRRLAEDPELAERSFVELASIATGVGPDQVARDLEARIAAGLEHLGRLAQRLDWQAIDPGVEMARAAFDRLPPTERLVAVIEARRAAVDDDTADALFAAALGCPPWRFDQANLGRLDLAWLDRLLSWSPARRLAWIRRRGSAWPLMVDDWVADHVIARAKLGVRQGGLDAADALLGALAHAFRADAEAWARRNGVAEDWRKVDALDGIANLPGALEGADGFRAADLAGALCFQDPRRRASSAAHEDLLVEVLGPALDGAARALDEARRVTAPKGAAAPALPAAPTTPTLAAKHLVTRTVSKERLDWDVADREAVAALLLALEVELQRRTTELLVRLVPEGAVDPAAGAGGTLGAIRVTEARIGRAEESRRYVVRDRGSRPKVIGREPGYELVHLVTRHPREFAGFGVRPTTRRERPDAVNTHDDGALVAAHLIGSVRHPYLVDLLKQRPSELELAEMQRQLALPEEDREAILELVEAAWHPDERMGGSGIEGWFDRELRGREGYTEFQGLQDRKGENRAPIHRPAEGGKDVWLTLDLELQRAAEEFLRAPGAPPPEESTDQQWFLFPVGAIVLARTDGEVLVAASAPIDGPKGARARGGVVPPDTDGQWLVATERTLGRPRFQPPGSIVKPLFAAYALQRLGVEFGQGLAACDGDSPRIGVGADPKSPPHAGFGVVDCNVKNGHSRVVSHDTRHLMTMSEALTVSCNSYFAALGERHYRGDSMRAALELFGLGRPTGVRFDPVGRTGLGEVSAFPSSDAFRAGRVPEAEVQRQYIANGLVHLEASVVQMARAYAGLATGALPTMRLVGRIGDEGVAADVEPLPIDAAHLERVRSSLRSVITDPNGSGHGKGLDKETLGYALAGKTGSADYRFISKPEGGATTGYMRKHAWFAGYFPAEAPRFVVILYVHDTATTASRITTYLASRFLQLPEVVEFLREEGVR